MTLSLYGAPEGADALLLARRRAEIAVPMLHLARDDASMAQMAEVLAFFAPEIEVLRLPAWDCLPYDRASPHPVIAAERIATLCRLLEPSPQPRILLSTVNAALQRLPPRARLAGVSLRLVAGGTVDPAELARFLEANGYGRSATVMEPGEYAVRGGIFDLFAAGSPVPVRLDFFGDQIETIRRFDPATQRSGERVGQILLHPVSEVPLDPESIARFRSGWREAFGPAAGADPLYQALSAGHRHPGMEHYLPLFHEGLETITEYMPGCAITLDAQAAGSATARLETIADHYAARREAQREGEPPYRSLPPAHLYLDATGWEAMLAAGSAVGFSPSPRPEGVSGVEAGGRPGPLFPRSEDVFAHFWSEAATWAAAGRVVLLAAFSRGSRERLAHLLAEHGAGSARAVESWAEARALPRGTVGLVTLGLERGFVLPDLAVVGEQDLLGARISRPPPRRKRADQFIAEATELAEGDLVVHQDHGIGRYDGLATLSVDGAAHDCLRLLYEGGDKLFLPVENIEILSRFGAGGAGVALDKLGGAGWQARKARAKSRIRDMAAQLLKIAAARRLQDAPSLTPEPGAWDEFCARFPFAETEDQTRAIAEVLEDLASGRPMDRLICGDVGFGKTEVALRAAFAAAMAGTQVAVVVPTTLLARQHFGTFSARFEGLPVRLAQLSRMVTPREAAEVRKGLAEGAVQIVIGTHALLSKSIAFADLGLLIIDEEQHFGVAHKERLKELRAGVHVLTLTATPITRTLQMALSGVREMSLIATPPVDRLAVRTFAMPFDSLVIREALARERFRGGQVFCVVPRIEHLSPMAERLAAIAPEARIAIAHGQMPPTALEAVMTGFGEGRHDVLLATDIIESGLDMPSVNTIVIHRADHFGLAQLYQLRGRVGRGKVRGYAYLTWPANQKLTTAAEKRLSVMQTLDALGAGFTLASHDLDIRGAGNLLGDEQSGRIREVGIELYQQMLEEAVAEMRAEKGRRAVTEEWTPAIVLGLSVLIPERYVADLPVRLGLYRRIAALASEAESEALAAEMVDRFGPLPEEVANLLAVVALKRACRAAGVEKIEAGPKGMVVSFRHNRFANPTGLVTLLTRENGRLRLRPDHKLALAAELDPGARARAARTLLADLGRIALQAAA